MQHLPGMRYSAKIDRCSQVTAAARLPVAGVGWPGVGGGCAGDRGPLYRWKARREDRMKKDKKKKVVKIDGDREES